MGGCASPSVSLRTFIYPAQENFYWKASASSYGPPAARNSPSASAVPCIFLVLVRNVLLLKNLHLHDINQLHRFFFCACCALCIFGARSRGAAFLQCILRESFRGFGGGCWLERIPYQHWRRHEAPTHFEPIPWTMSNLTP